MEVPFAVSASWKARIARKTANPTVTCVSIGNRDLDIRVNPPYESSLRLWSRTSASMLSPQIDFVNAIRHRPWVGPAGGAAATRREAVIARMGHTVLTFAFGRNRVAAGIWAGSSRTNPELDGHNGRNQADLAGGSFCGGRGYSGSSLRTGCTGNSSPGGAARRDHKYSQRGRV